MAESPSQSRLTHAQKMEAIALLAGGIAHDFNNILAVILGQAGFLMNEALTVRQSKRVEVIHQAGERAAALTRKLLAFSRLEMIEPRVFDLNVLITELMKMLRRLIREDVELVTRLGAEPATVRADPGQIEQVIINLAINARDAMPQGGTLTIETAMVDTAPAGSVLLTITDTGSGMTEGVKAHLFEAFFTTKGSGRGTGLGLAAAQRIIEQSGGKIMCESELGQGARFAISLPLAHGPVTPVRDPWVYSDLPRGAETILLVEDDRDLREIASEILTQLGYRVLDAGHAEAALQLLRNHPGAVHLLLTDVVMPGMSGRKLAEQVCATRPETKVLYVSGHTDDVILHAGVFHGSVALLRKPFTPLGLARKVRETLDLG